MWHMTCLIHGKQDFEHPEKHQAQPKTRKKASYNMANIQWSKEREIELIDSSVLQEIFSSIIYASYSALCV